jgi:predicted RNA-binding protein
MSIEEYEPVASRFGRFIDWCIAHGRKPQVLTNMISEPGAAVCVFKTTIQLEGVIVSTGWAEEIRDTSGKRTVNATSHVENCETSSLGRCLSNFPLANFAGTDYAKRPSREEMQKVQRQQKTVHVPPSTNNAIADANGITVRGNQWGPLPDWLAIDAFTAGVFEVYDNRDQVAGTKRPWFKATTGGKDAKAFWPPKGTPDPIVATHEDDLADPSPEDPF